MENNKLHILYGEDRSQELQHGKEGIFINIYKDYNKNF